MRRKVMGRLFCVITLCVGLIGLSGCTFNQEEELVTMPTEGYKVYDVRSYMDEFTLDGKRIGFPFQIEDLPENYTMQNEEREFNYEKLKGENEFSATYLKNGKSIDIDITIKCKKKENIIDNGRVCFISCRDIDENSEPYDFSIKGIGKGSTISEAIEEFGEPSMIDEYDGGINIIYKSDEENIIVFLSYDGENINSMYMNCSLD